MVYIALLVLQYICMTQVVFLQDHVCSVAKIPFRGAPCSDPVGHQVPYKAIMKQIVPRSLSGILWDKEQKAPYVEYKASCIRFLYMLLFFLNHLFIILYIKKKVTAVHLFIQDLIPPGKKPPCTFLVPIHKIPVISWWSISFL